MLHIYLVRHGETENNKKHLHQPDAMPLNARGHDQAVKAARILSAKELDTIVTSALIRAAQTARIIGGKLALEPSQNVLFAELRRPDRLIGRHHFSLASLWYMLRWFFYRDEIYWKQIGGESREAFLLRIAEARYYLESLPDNAKVVVVSHSIFINFFVEHLCNDRPVGLIKAVLLLLKIKLLDNSSITRVTYDPNAAEGTCAWTLVSFDEDGHVEGG